MLKVPNLTTAVGLCVSYLACMTLQQSSTDYDVLSGDKVSIIVPDEAFYDPAILDRVNLVLETKTSMILCPKKAYPFIKEVLSISKATGFDSMELLAVLTNNSIAKLTLDTNTGFMNMTRVRDMPAGWKMIKLLHYQSKNDTHMNLDLLYLLPDSNIV